MKDPYLVKGAEIEDEDYGEELPCHHTFEEDDDFFDSQHDMSDSDESMDRGYHHEFSREDEHYEHDLHAAHAHEDEERQEETSSLGRANC